MDIIKTLKLDIDANPRQFLRENNRQNNFDVFISFFENLFNELFCIKIEKNNNSENKI